MLGDQLAKNLDWPGADVIAQRLAALLPGPLQGGQPGQPGGDPQTAQAVQAASMAQQQVQKLTTQLSAMQADRNIDLQKLQVEMYRAQTDRMTATANMQKP
jgi:hypothetical protein